MVPNLPSGTSSTELQSQVIAITLVTHLYETMYFNKLLCQQLPNSFLQQAPSTFDAIMISLADVVRFKIVDNLRLD